MLASVYSSVFPFHVVFVRFPMLFCLLFDRNSPQQTKVPLTGWRQTRRLPVVPGRTSLKEEVEQRGDVREVLWRAFVHFLCPPVGMLYLYKLWNFRRPKQKVCRRPWRHSCASKICERESGWSKRSIGTCCGNCTAAATTTTLHNTTLQCVF